MALTADTAFYQIDGSGKVTVEDLRQAIEGGQFAVTAHAPSGLQAAASLQLALQALSARVKALEDAA